MLQVGDRLYIEEMKMAPFLFDSDRKLCRKFNLLSSHGQQPHDAADDPDDLRPVHENTRMGMGDFSMF